jgi:beta-galactosidase
MLKFNHNARRNVVRKKALSVVTPVITGQPVLQIAEPGQIASFSVVVADTSGVTYQWMFNGTPNIPGNPSATGDSLLVTVPNITTNNPNVGKYSVVVANSAGSVTSTPALLLLDSNDDGLPDQGPADWFPP